MGLFDFAGALSGGGLSTTNTASYGPVVAGPVAVNVAGFGSKANSETSASASQVPAAGGELLGSDYGISDQIPSWVLPGLGALALLALLTHRKR